jgi:hypothetical protein
VVVGDLDACRRAALGGALIGQARGWWPFGWWRPLPLGVAAGARPALLLVG